MEQEPPPSYPFYGRDFDTSTASWPNQDVGAYVRLLNHQWYQRGLPNSMVELATIMREPIDVARTLWRRRLKAKFQKSSDGKLRNARLERVRRKLEGYRARQIEAGRAGAEARWGRHGGAIADAGHPVANGQSMALQSASASSPTGEGKNPPRPPRKRGGDRPGRRRDAGLGPDYGDRYAAAPGTGPGTQAGELAQRVLDKLDRGEFDDELRDLACFTFGHRGPLNQIDRAHFERLAKGDERSTAGAAG